MSKKIVRVAIGGLDTNSSLDRVNEGAFETIHNARLVEGGGCKSVGEFETHSKIINSNEFEIVYKHPSLPENQYIATKNRTFYLVNISDGQIIQNNVLINLDARFDNCNIEYFAYGNIFYITLFENQKAIEEFIFMYDKGMFVSIDFNKITPPEPSEIEYDRKSSSSTILQIPSIIATAKFTESPNLTKPVIESYDRKYMEIIDDFIKSDYIYGTQFLFFAYKLFDGTVIKNSRIYQMDCEMEAKATESSLYYKKENNDLKITFYKILNAIKPKITFKTTQDVLNNPLIESILIYSTRNYPIYKLDNLYNDLNFEDSTNADINLPVLGAVKNISSRSIVDKINYDSPKGLFYEIAEVNFRENTSIELNYSTHYSNIEQMSIFNPTISLHKILSNGKFEYNSRLHIYNLTTDYFNGETILRNEDEVKFANFIYRKESISSGKIVFRYKIISAMESIIRESETSAYLYKKYIGEALQQGLYIVIPNLLTYQDANAKSISIFFENIKGERFFLKEFALKSAYSNNYAYFQNTNIDRLFSHYAIAVNKNLPAEKSFEKRCIEATNHLIVSNIDNPFVYSTKNTILVSNSQTTICAINITMDQLTESGFGTYPLYIFTDRGVYALQSGSDGVLYSSQVKINNDAIIKGSKTIAALNRIYFCTQKGLFSIQGRNSYFHSQNLDYIFKNTIPFIQYIKSSALYFTPCYNELIIHNREYDFAVVYSIENNGFYTRDFYGKSIDNEHIIYKNKILKPLSLEKEDSKIASELYSRELKLGNLDYKRVSKVIVRGDRSSGFSMRLLGSNDAKQWQYISECKADSDIRRTSASWRYFKIEIYDENLNISYVDFEYKDRFIDGLR